MVVHVCNPSTQETEVSLSYKKRQSPGKKKKFNISIFNMRNSDSKAFQKDYTSNRLNTVLSVFTEHLKCVRYY
jgi:hypothetical protein